MVGIWLDRSRSRMLRLHERRTRDLMSYKPASHSRVKDGDGGGKGWSERRQRRGAFCSAHECAYSTTPGCSRGPCWLEVGWACVGGLVVATVDHSQRCEAMADRWGNGGVGKIMNPLVVCGLGARRVWWRLGEKGQSNLGLQYSFKRESSLHC